MPEHMEPKWEKWVVEIITLGPEMNAWLGPFNSEPEAQKYANKYFPKQFIQNVCRRKDLCGAAIHPTKKFRLPKKVTGYVRADYRRRLWIEDMKRHRYSDDAYPKFASLAQQALKPKMVLVHPTREKLEKKGFDPHSCSRGRDGFTVNLNRESILEKIGCYRPTAVAEMETEFLSVVDHKIDPACRLFEVEAKIADVLPSSYDSISFETMTVVKEIDAGSADVLYKKHHAFYRRREGLEDVRIKVTPKMRKMAANYLSEVDGNKIKAMLRIAAEGQVRYRTRHDYHKKLIKSVHELTMDDRFMSSVIKAYPYMNERGGAGVMGAMVHVCQKLRKELVIEALDG